MRAAGHDQTIASSSSVGAGAAVARPRLAGSARAGARRRARARPRAAAPGSDGRARARAASRSSRVDAELALREDVARVVLDPEAMRRHPRDLVARVDRPEARVRPAMARQEGGVHAHRGAPARRIDSRQPGRPEPAHDEVRARRAHALDRRGAHRRLDAGASGPAQSGWRAAGAPAPAGRPPHRRCRARRAQGASRPAAARRTRPWLRSPRLAQGPGRRDAFSSCPLVPRRRASSARTRRSGIARQRRPTIRW